MCAPEPPPMLGPQVCAAEPPPMLGSQVCAAPLLFLFFPPFNMSSEDANLGLQARVGGNSPMPSSRQPGPRALASTKQMPSFCSLSTSYKL